jgi:hypothetical protein
VTGWELLVVAVAVAAALAHSDTGTEGEVSGPLPPGLCLRTEEPTTRARDIVERSES